MSQTDMTSSESVQQVRDEVQLQALALAYKLTAGLAAFFSLFGLLYAGMFGLMFGAMSHLPNTKAANAPPPEVGWIFAAFGLGLFAFMVLFAVLNWRTARCLEKRTSHVFCQFMAGLNCLHVPYGTAIGVCTFLVLARPSVAERFARSGRASDLGA